MKVREFITRPGVEEGRHWFGIVHISARVTPGASLDAERIKELDLESLLHDASFCSRMTEELREISAEIRELMK